MLLTHAWMFNAQMLDFVLEEITYLEESTGPTVQLEIGGAPVVLPASWSILCVDKETYTVDAIPVTACAAFEQLAFVFSPEDGKLIMLPIKAIGYAESAATYHPTIDKARALVHAISPGVLHGKEIARGVVVGPADMWRYIAGKTVGDILS